MSVSIGMTAMMMLAMVSAAQAQSAQPDFPGLYLSTLTHCGVGRPYPHGDVPLQEWRREMRLCKIDRLKAVKFYVGRYPPSDPRKRE